MTALENFIRGLICSVKRNPSFEGIRFIDAYNLQTAEKPVEGITALVEMAGFDDGIKLNIRLIGGNDISGRQLGYTAVELAAALKEADNERCIDTVLLSETKYDKNITSFYRDIKLSLLSDAGGCDSFRRVSLSLNGQALGGVNAFKWEEKAEGVSLYEFHRGNPYAVINSKGGYEVTIELKSLPSVSLENGFVLKAVYESDTMSFINCVINKISTSVNAKGQIVYTIKIISTEKVTA